VTLATVVDEMTSRGFREDFRVVDGRLLAVGSGETLGSGDLVIREFHRFEGISDPDDMAIVYGIESVTGLRGTLVDAYGVYADPALSAFLEDVKIDETAYIGPRVPLVTEASLINDVLTHYPSTAPLFIDYGRLYVDRPRELYASFPGLSVGEYLERNGLDRLRVLEELNAAAESDDHARRWGIPTGEAAIRPDFSLALGYTAAYRPREDAVPDKIPVVAVQAARGPE